VTLLRRFIVDADDAVYLHPGTRWPQESERLHRHWLEPAPTGQRHRPRRQRGGPPGVAAAHTVSDGVYEASRILADLRAEHNAQKLKIA